MTHTRQAWLNFALILALLLAAMPLTAAQFAAQVAAQEPVARDEGTTKPLQAPVIFEANQGQFDEVVRFVTRLPGDQGSGATFWFMAGGLRVVLSRAQAETPAQEQALEQLGLTIRFLGASPGARIEGQDLLSGRVNYFLGRDPARWRQNVPTFGSILYRGLYPDTDLRYYGKDGRLKYDFMLRPGANVEAIALAYEGATDLRVNRAGQLEIQTAWGRLVEEAPLAWQVAADGEPAPVAVSYRLEDGNRLGFRLGAYDHSRPLVLDPTLNYGTYIGGRNRDLAHAVVVDAQGNAFVTGSTTSTDFPVTDGAFAQERGGGWDTYVSKLAPDGGSLLFSTYVGGDGAEVGYGLALDAAGNVILAGATGSTDFPTTSGAYKSVYNGGEYDAFVLKLAAGGDSLLYSTYVGGKDKDLAYAVAQHDDGPVITGLTESPSFPTSGTAFDETHNGLGDVFVAQLSAGGNSLRYSTLAGGSGEDLGRRLAVTRGGDVVVTGHTTSANFPTTNGAFAPDLRGKQDAFVLKLEAGGRSLDYSTYLGGKADDYGNGLALDRKGDPVVAGTTRSDDFPTTESAYDPDYNGYDDAFVLKLTDGGQSLAWSTYLGGSEIDSGMVVELDAAGNPIVAGASLSTNFPTSDDAFDAGASGEGDAFLAKVDASGEALIYSTYLGGSALDEATGLALTSQGDALVAGWTESGDFPTTEDAFQPAFNYRQDGFVLRFDGLGDPPPLAVQAQVAQSSDDAVERSDDGAVDLDSPSLAFIGEAGTYTAGLRFPGLALPQDAKVLDAYVEFTAADTDRKSTRLDFHGQAADDAGTFASAARDISDRALTTAAVSWNVPNWSQTGATYRSPDLSSIVQEVVDRSGWLPGQALVLILSGSGKREAVSYDGDPDGAPRLYVEYEGEAPDCYNLTTVADPAEGGTVAASPAANCAASSYLAGTQVTLTAQPAEGYVFQGWSGDAGGSANPTTITMDGDKAVTGRFRDEDAPVHLLYLPVARRAVQ